jgi:hypothetical protein
VEITLLLKGRAPVPRAGETSVDTTPRIIKVIRAAPIERMSEKVAEDLEVERVERTVLGIDICAQRRRLVQRR